VIKINTNPSTETNDPEFRPKLIAGYDKNLECYDKYPELIWLESLTPKDRTRKSHIGIVSSVKVEIVKINCLRIY